MYLSLFVSHTTLIAHGQCFIVIAYRDIPVSFKIRSIFDALFCFDLFDLSDCISCYMFIYLHVCYCVLCVSFTFICHMGRDGQIYMSVSHSTFTLYITISKFEIIVYWVVFVFVIYVFNIYHYHSLAPGFS